MISQGIAQGEFAVWVNPETAAFLMETLFYQFGRYLVRRLDFDQSEDPGARLQEDRMVEQVLHILVDQLEAGMKRNPQQRNDYFPKG